ncbi:MAG: SDR family oxidoreductase [Flavobacteriales bacterium]|nr:SDR family oxidoreductase [Flavobacteriales bacterium]
MKQPICLITGATAGIGLETAKQLAKKGFNIYITGRGEEKCVDAINQINQTSPGAAMGYILCDFSSQHSIREAAQKIRNTISNLHILINNAGAVYQQKELTEEGIEKTFATNHLGYFLLTHLLLPIMPANQGCRIINVASDAHFSARLNLEDITNPKKYFIFQAYANSKLANIMFTFQLAEKLNPLGITANCLHPGVVKTRIGNKNTAQWMGWLWNAMTAIRGISVEKGAATSVYLASSQEVSSITGKYFSQCRESKPSSISMDVSLQQQLWGLSEKLCGIQSYI